MINWIIVYFCNDHLNLWSKTVAFCLVQWPNLSLQACYGSLVTLPGSRVLCCCADATGRWHPKMEDLTSHFLALRNGGLFCSQKQEVENIKHRRIPPFWWSKLVTFAAPIPISSLVDVPFCWSKWMFLPLKFDLEPSLPGHRQWP